jgi:hypothetical protein
MTYVRDRCRAVLPGQGRHHDQDGEGTDCVVELHEDDEEVLCRLGFGLAVRRARAELASRGSGVVRHRGAVTQMSADQAVHRQKPREGYHGRHEPERQTEGHARTGVSAWAHNS